MAQKSLNPIQVKTARRQLQALTGLLTLQFILGIALTTLIDYKPGKHSNVQAVFLVSHIIVAFGLLATAVVHLSFSLKRHYLVPYSITILLSIVGAMIAGTITARTGNNAAAFIMAMFFLSAFGAIGYSMSSFHD